jgi:multimeric flavodoxin WrbA/nitrite reductase/ring-hydroxylating ferredoxin subunit
MTNTPKWTDLGAAGDLAQKPLQRVTAGGVQLAMSFREGTFGAIHNACNHVGGPLGDGTLEGDYVTCPWHYWKFHRATGKGEPGFEADCVPSFPVKVEDGRVFADLANPSRRTKAPHDPHPLERPVVRAPGPLRVACISTTAMDGTHPRFSGSDHLLSVALEAARDAGAEAQMIRLDDLKFRNCEGFYSKGARACTWPCSITLMDKSDEMERIYEAMVHWADVILVATPIRWGAASALWFKMAERLNCVQNAITTHNKVLIRNKVAGLIIVGGQDNIQGVAGQMLGFLGELGYLFPQFPYIAHSRGWSREDMERNVEIVKNSRELADGAKALAARCLDLAGRLIATDMSPEHINRGGRKAHDLDVK